MRFRDAKDTFLRSKKAAGATESTIRDYTSSIRNFCRFAVNQEIHSIEDVTPRLIEEYLISKREGNSSLIAKVLHAKPDYEVSLSQEM